MRVVVVAGSRVWRDRAAIERALLNAELLIVGDALGADAIAHQVAREWDIIVAEYKAEWARYGRSRAGPIRNAAMVRRAFEERAAGMDIRCYAFPLAESSGTWDCARQLKGAGFYVHIAA